MIPKRVAWYRVRSLSRQCCNVASISQRKIWRGCRSCITIMRMGTWSTTRRCRLTWACTSTRLSTSAVITRDSRIYRGWGTYTRLLRKNARCTGPETTSIPWTWWKTTHLWRQGRVKRSQLPISIDLYLSTRNMSLLVPRSRTLSLDGRRTSVTWLWCISAKIPWVKFKRAFLWYLCRSLEYCSALSALIFRNRP